MRLWRALVCLVCAGLTAGPLLGQVYEIGAGDVLRVSVTRQPGLSGEYPVESTGMMA